MNTSSYSLFPNPNNGVFTLKHTPAENVSQSSGRITGARMKVRIYPMSQSVLQKELPVELSVSGECTVNAGDLPEGFYIVQIFSGDNCIEALKMQIDK
jgi:hypothetical protein